MSAYLFEIIGIFVLVLVSGFFAAAEIALISASRPLLRQRAEEGETGARIALQAARGPVAPARGRPGGDHAGRVPGVRGRRRQPRRRAGRVARVVRHAAGASPARWPSSSRRRRSATCRSCSASSRPNAWACSVPSRSPWPSRGPSRGSRPSRRRSPGCSRAPRTSSAALIGLHAGGKPGVTEEELRLLVTEQGTLLDEEKRMIAEVFELGDTAAREIMVPRVDMVMLEDTTSLGRRARGLPAHGVLAPAGVPRGPGPDRRDPPAQGRAALRARGPRVPPAHRAHPSRGRSCRRRSASWTSWARCRPRATRWRSSWTSTAAPRDS